MLFPILINLILTKNLWNQSSDCARLTDEDHLETGNARCLPGVPAWTGGPWARASALSCSGGSPSAPPTPLWCVCSPLLRAPAHSACRGAARGWRRPVLGLSVRARPARHASPPCPWWGPVTEALASLSWPRERLALAAAVSLPWARGRDVFAPSFLPLCGGDHRRGSQPELGIGHGLLHPVLGKTCFCPGCQHEDDFIAAQHCGSSFCILPLSIYLPGNSYLDYYYWITSWTIGCGLHRLISFFSTLKKACSFCL